MKIYRGLILMFISFTLLSATACTSNTTSNAPQNADSNEQASAEYEQISPEQAKKLMETQADYVIIDARTQEEFLEGHIEGAVLIPEYEITNRAEDELPDKKQLILVYCRSGRRSKIASQALADLGYTNVKEFGGIIDWPYETVK